MTSTGRARESRGGPARRDVRFALRPFLRYGEWGRFSSVRCVKRPCVGRPPAILSRRGLPVSLLPKDTDSPEEFLGVGVNRNRLVGSTFSILRIFPDFRLLCCRCNKCGTDQKELNHSQQKVAIDTRPRPRMPAERWSDGRGQLRGYCVLHGQAVRGESRGREAHWHASGARHMGPRAIGGTLVPPRYNPNQRE